MIRNRTPFLYTVMFLSVFLLSGHAQSSDATDYVALARSQLVEMDENDTNENWFYTATIQTDGETLVSKNDPGKEEGERRELISVNGKPPTPERLKKFEKREAKRVKNKDKDRSRSRFSEMVDFSSLRLVEVNNGQAVLSFTPVLDRLKDESDKVDGSLRMNAETHLIEAFSLANTEKLSPVFSVSLMTFIMDFAFLPVDGEVLVSRMSISIEGKAAFLKEFRESTEIMFSDYRRKVSY